MLKTSILVLHKMLEFFKNMMGKHFLTPCKAVEPQQSVIVVIQNDWKC